MNGWILIGGGVLVVLAAGSVWTRYRAARAEARYPPCGAFIEIEGIRLHYVRRGQGRTVVLLHGSDGFVQDFMPTLLDRLAEEFDVIALDRPGHGYSDGPLHEAATPKVQLRLILGALRQMGVERAVWVAHSWSGLLAMMAALEHPEVVAALVLLAPWIYPPRSAPPRLLGLLLIPLLGEVIAGACIPLIKGYVIRRALQEAFWPDPVPAAYAACARALWLRNARQVRIFARETLTDRPALREYSPRYAEVAAPVVGLTGDSDRDVDPEEHVFRLRSVLPNMELMELQATGHEIPQTRLEAVVAAVQRSSERVSGLETGRPAARETPPRELARELVLRFGWNATAYQILNPQIELWFSAERDAVVGFVRREGFCVVAGAPVCAEERLPEVVAEFETAVEREGEKVCYFAAAARLQGVLQALPHHTSLVIGAQPVWNPLRWEPILAKTASLRAQLNRARNKGIQVSEWPKERAQGNPELQRCQQEWLATRQLPTLHFLTEPVNLDDLADRRVFVAETEAQVVGFLVATPVPDRNGWLIEQIVRGEGAPNGTAELMVDGVMCAFLEGGYSYVTLGLSPLSRRAPATEEAKPLPWLRLLLRWVRAHGKRFYNFEGLDAFKAKFRPEAWEPLTAITNEPRISMQALYAIAAAFSAGTPLSSLAHALLSAVRQEIVWLMDRGSSHEQKKEKKC